MGLKIRNEIWKISCKLGSVKDESRTDTALVARERTSP